MKIDRVQIISSGNMSASSINSIGLTLDQLFGGSIQAVVTSGTTARGYLKIQVSNDIVPLKPSAAIAGTPVSQPVGSDPAGNVVNWTDYSNSIISVSGNSSHLININNNIGFNWIRLVYTKISGSGTLNANFMGKG